MPSCGGPRSQRAVHEGFQLCEVQKGIVRVMAGTAFFERADGGVEGDPLGEAQRQLVLLLHRFENEPVVPVGEVLHGGDAMRKGIFNGQLQRLAPCGEVRWRNLRLHELTRGAFAKDARGVALRVAVDLAALRIRRTVVDACELQRGRVHHGDVAVGALEIRRMIACDCIEILTRGQRL
jgi:hypothetical protein